MFTLPNRREDSGVSLRDYTGTPTTPEAGPGLVVPSPSPSSGLWELWETRGQAWRAFSKACGKMAGKWEGASFPQAGSFHSPSEGSGYPQILRKTQNTITLVSA